MSLKTFRIRSIKPNLSRWFEVSSNSYIEAIQFIHSSFVPSFSSGENVINSIIYRTEDDGNGSESIFL